MKKVTLILAGNYKQYSNWLYENVLGKGNVEDYRYAENESKIRGLSARGVIIIGTFWEDFPEPQKMHDLAFSLIRN